MQFAYIKEVTPGTTPDTPAGQVLRLAGFDGGISVTYLESKEIRDDRMEAPGAMDVIEASPSLSGEVSYATLDDILECIFGAAWATNVLKVGTSYVPSTITGEHKDEGTTATEFQAYLGFAPSKLTISGGLGQKVEFAVDGVVMAVPASTVSTLFSSTVPANTNPVFGPSNGQGSISLAGAALKGCTKWSFTFDNSANVNRACYQAGAHSLRQKAMKITATMDVYHEDATNYGRLTAGTEIAAKLVLGNGTTKSYDFDFARSRVTDVKCPEGDGVRTESIGLRMFVPTSGTDTACKITRKV